MTEGNRHRPPFPDLSWFQEHLQYGFEHLANGQGHSDQQF